MIKIAHLGRAREQWYSMDASERAQERGQNRSLWSGSRAVVFNGWCVLARSRHMARSLILTTVLNDSFNSFAKFSVQKLTRSTCV